LNWERTLNYRLDDRRIQVRRSNEQLLLTAHDGGGWLAALACRIVDAAPQQNCGR
jgi:hypothetical protein